MQSRTGKLCKIAQPQSKEEAELVYLIVEDNGNRLIIRPTGEYWEKWAIIPTELVHESDITLIEEEN